jgi:plastocyanin
MRHLLIGAGLVLQFYGNAFAATADRTVDRARPVNVVLSNFAFTPQMLHLRHGRAYRLHFVNQGSDSHNFSAPEFFAAARINPADIGAISGGKVELGKGESRDVRLVPAIGTYNATCTHFLHASFGMTGGIAVD